MKILFLTDDFPPKSYGGAGIVAFNDAKFLTQRGYDVVVITTTDNPADVGEKIIDSVRTISLFSKYNPRWRHYINIYNVKIVKEIANIIDKEKPDIVHAHNIHTHISYKSLDISCKKVKKVFLTAHDVMLVSYGKYVENPKIADVLRYKVNLLDLIKDFGFQFNPLKNFFIKRYTKKVTKVFSVSDSLRKFLNVNGINNLETIHNGIDINSWNVDNEKVLRFVADKKLTGKKVVLFCGRVSGLKGAKVTLEAFSLVLKTLPDIKLLFIGSVNKNIHLFFECLDEEVKKNTVFVDWVDNTDMKNIYRVADVVVVPSLYLDPFPTINLEAMASLKPVIGTIFGGTPEIVKDGITGYIVDPNNIKEFSNKILDVLKNDNAKVFGEAGFKRVSEEFSMDKHIDKLVNFYNS